MENNYTKFNHDLESALMRGDFSFTETKILLCINRNTIGFHKPVANISVAFIEQQTKIKPQHIRKCLSELKKRMVIYRTDKLTGINFNYFKSYPQPLPKSVPLPNSGSPEICEGTPPEICDPPLPDFGRAYINKTPDKENLKEMSDSACGQVEPCSFFVLFWKTYPRHEKRKRAEEIFNKLKPDEQTLNTMLNWIKTELEIRSIRQSQKMFNPDWPLPDNFLSDERWLDEHSARPTQEAQSPDYNPRKPCQVQNCENEGTYATLYRCVLCDEHFEAVHYGDKSILAEIQRSDEDKINRPIPTYQAQIQNRSKPPRFIRDILEKQKLLQ